MAIVRALDNNGDWMFGAGLSSYKSGQSCVQQNLQTRITSFLGDCFFDLGAGIDWFNLLGSTQQVALNLAINTTIVNTPDVISPTVSTLAVTGILQTNLTYTPSTRAISFTYSVTTIYSVLTGTFTYDLGV